MIPPSCGEMDAHCAKSRWISCDTLGKTRRSPIPRSCVLSFHYNTFARKIQDMGETLFSDAQQCRRFSTSPSLTPPKPSMAMQNQINRKQGTRFCGNVCRFAKYSCEKACNCRVNLIEYCCCNSDEPVKGGADLWQNVMFVARILLSVSRFLTLTDVRIELGSPTFAE